MRTRRWYVGVPAKLGEGYRAFRCRFIPTARSHGRSFAYVLGPFRSERGARWAERFGYANPAFVSVGAAERIAKFQQEV